MQKLSLVPLVLLAAMSFGSVVSAESYFTNLNKLPAKGLLRIGTVTSDGDGVVEVYDFRTGQQGEMLGAVNVRQGANTDVRLHIGMPPLGNVLAILNVNGQVVATKVYDICENC